MNRCLTLMSEENKGWDKGVRKAENVSERERERIWGRKKGTLTISQCPSLHPFWNLICLSWSGRSRNPVYLIYNGIKNVGSLTKSSFETQIESGHSRFRSRLYQEGLHLYAFVPRKFTVVSRVRYQNDGDARLVQFGDIVVRIKIVVVEVSWSGSKK